MKRAYFQLCENYRDGDRIFIFGFSRGAATARRLANYIDKKGVNAASVSIELLGLWDTVAAFGIPSNFIIRFQKINLGMDFRAGKNVRKVCHLVSIDENRAPYEPTLFDFEERIEEIWFPGVHSDVGGGFADRGLSSIALKFMVNRAGGLGVKFDQGYLDKYLQVNVNGELHLYFWDKTLKDSNGLLLKTLDSMPEMKNDELGNRLRSDAYKIRSRKILAQGKYREKADGLIKIHQSAFHRMETDKTYRPSGLLNLKAFSIVDDNGNVVKRDE